MSQYCDLLVLAKCIKVTTQLDRKHAPRNINPPNSVVLAFVTTAVAFAFRQNAEFVRESCRSTRLLFYQDRVKRLFVTGVVTGVHTAAVPRCLFPTRFPSNRNFPSTNRLWSVYSALLSDGVGEDPLPPTKYGTAPESAPEQRHHRL